ncbi:MAG: magnesium transporter CorA family protein [Nitrososphaeraceae archaeon]
MAITSYLINSMTIKPVDLSVESKSIMSKIQSTRNEFLWVHASDIKDITKLQDIFNLHPLEVESVINQNHPSKIEGYEGYIFAIIDGVKEGIKKDNFNDEIKKDDSQTKNQIDIENKIFVEDDLFIFLENKWIITINFHNGKFEDKVKKRLEHFIHQYNNNIKDLNSSDSSFDNIVLPEYKGIEKMNEAVYRIAFEEMISSYYPVLDSLREDLEEAEDYILDSGKGGRKVTRNQLADLLLIRRKITTVERALDMISRAVDDFTGIIGIMDQDISVTDLTKIESRLTRIFGKEDLLTIETIRHMYWIRGKIKYLLNDLINIHNRILNLHEAYNSSLSANLNETIRTLTVIATIVLPLTLITGIYGMNFEFMPKFPFPYGFLYALSLLLIVGGGMVLYFRKRRWI